MVTKTAITNTATLVQCQVCGGGITPVIVSKMECRQCSRLVCSGCLLAGDTGRICHPCFVSNKIKLKINEIWDSIPVEERGDDDADIRADYEAAARPGRYES